MADVSLTPTILLMGPTASGKTALALALAERLPCEIISVDSAQVYRGMDIGTAKPDAATQAAVPHHLIDIRDPAQAYSAAEFALDALKLVGQIRCRGRVPLLVGGTMLYFRALMRGLSDLPSADAGLRRVIEADARRLGWPAMHQRLAQRDPQTAARLHPNDQQRIQRALEVVELSGRPMADHFRSRSPVLPLPAISLLMQVPDRAELHRRIERRFHQMMEAGFLDEVRRLHERKDLDLECPALRSVGYRQLWLHLDGRCDLATAVQSGVAATRQFAKRQLTWLRHETDALSLDSTAPDLIERACKSIGML